MTERALQSEIVPIKLEYFDRDNRKENGVSIEYNSGLTGLAAALQLTEPANQEPQIPCNMHTS